MGLSGSCSPRGHCSRARSVGFGHRVSIFLHPFAPPALPGFIATMSAVTPAGGLALRLLNPLATHAGLLASRNPPSEPSVSNHRPAPIVALTPNPSALSASSARAQVWASPLDRRLARRYGRIEFLSVRMTLSPPVAPHPASWRRSYIRLQAGVGIPGEDLHLPDRLRLPAHGPGFPPGQRPTRGFIQDGSADAAGPELGYPKPVASFPCAGAFGDRRWRDRGQVVIGPPSLFGLVRRDDLGA